MEPGCPALNGIIGVLPWQCLHVTIHGILYTEILVGLLVSLIEVALVKWTESVGMALVHRELNSMQIKIQNGHILSYSILQIFPFKSETKRMGIILQVCVCVLLWFHYCF